MLTVQGQKGYIVQGQVRDELGRPMWGKVVRAFDVDLRSETMLGETTTDSRGTYLIEYCPGADGCSETGGPDLVVRVYTPGDGYPDTNPEDLDLRIWSDISFNVTENETVNLTLAEEAFVGESEYELIEAALEPSLDDVSPDELTDPEVAFLAGDTENNHGQIEAYRNAHVLAATALDICQSWIDDPENVAPENESYNLVAEVFYGWLRRDLSSEFTKLFQLGTPMLQGAVEESIAGNIIPAWLGDNTILSDINTRIAEHAFHERSKLGALDSTLLDALIEQGGSTLNDTSDRYTVLTALANHTGTEDDFWAGLLEQLGTTKTTEVKSTFELSRISLGHTTLINQLQTEVWDGNNPKPEWVARKSLLEWQTLVTQTLAPDGISVSDYANHLYQSAEIAYPSARIVHRVLTETPADSSEALLQTFFNDNMDFKFEDTEIDDLNASEDVAEELKERQRIFRLVPAVGRWDSMRALKTAGIASAQDIAAMGYGSFVEQFTLTLGGLGGVAQVWDEAWRRALAAQIWTMKCIEGYYGFNIEGAVETHQDNSDEQSNWRAQFGSLDFCQCDHCKSVHGPAAYMADLLNWLERAPKNTNDETPAQVLFKLRPDLQHLKLSCQNTNTILPYIDLANEVMENAVSTPADYSVYQTTKTSEELNALPEHFEINRPAYNKLAEAAFPWRLPFDVDSEEVWALFEHLGYNRHSSRQILRRYESGPNDENAAALDHLGINNVELQLITGDDIVAPNTSIDLTGSLESDHEDLLWGFKNDADWFKKLQSVSTFLEKATFGVPGTKLDYKTLRQLIVTKTIQAVYTPSSLVQISFNADEPCDLDKAKLVLVGWTADTVEWKNLFNVARRFLRLQEKLGWSVPELDKALVSLGVDLNNPPMQISVLTVLSRIEWLHSVLKVPVVELLSCWNTIDTQEDLSEDKDAEKELSLYERVFLAPPQETNSVFLLNGARSDLAVPGSLVADHCTAVAGALRISEIDLELLMKYLGFPPLNLATLSRLYGLVSLADRLGVTIRQIMSLVGLIGSDPTDSGKTPADAMTFVKRVQTISSSNLSIEELDYLFRHEFRVKEGVAPTIAEKSQVLADLQTALGTIETAFEQDGVTQTALTVSKKKQVICQKLASELSLSSDITELLTSEILTGGSVDSCTVQEDLLNAENGGLWASYFTSDNLDYSVSTVKHDQIDAPMSSTNTGFKFSWNSIPSFLDDSPAPTMFSVRWEGVIRAKSSGSYKFFVESTANSSLWISGQEISLGNEDIQLRAGVGYQIRLEVSKSGGYPANADLKWQTPESDGFETVPTKRLLPSVLLESYELAYKAAVLIAKLSLDVSMLSYLAVNSADFTGFDGLAYVGFDLDELPLTAAEPDFPLGPWEQLNDILEFANAFPNANTRVFDILSGAKKDLGEGRDQLLAMTGWDADSVDRICNWNATSYTSAIDLANDLKVAFNDHIINQPEVHEIAGTNAVTANVATDLSSAITLANDIKTQYEIHRNALNTVHTSIDNDNVVSAAFADNWLTLVTLLNELQEAYNDHCESASSFSEAQDILNELRLEYKEHRVTTADGVHGAEDDQNIAIDLEASSQATAESLANSLRTNYEAHRVLENGVHSGEDNLNTLINVPAANDLYSLLFLVRALKMAFEGHRVQVEGPVHGAEDRENSVESPDIGTNSVHLTKDTVNISGAAPAVSILPDSLHDALDVSKTDLECGRKLTELHSSMKKIIGLGINAEQFVEWAQEPIDITLTNSAREAVRSKYGPDRWLSVIGTLRNDLRRKQRDSLVSYLVHKEAYLNTINDLYGELLIDAGMEPCMKTSRLKQALNAIQLFIHRCLMSLETSVELTDNHEKEWRWRKNYRVWEANRKVFLYPENWIEPDLRDDKTPFFKDLERELLENEVTDEAAERAYRRYLEKLSDINHLEIIAACEERKVKEHTVHVFGRTRGVPHSYYYRQCIVDLDNDNAVEWTPWESVDLDIPGDHVVPIIWNRRLHLYWPILEERVKTKKVTKTSTAVDEHGNPIASSNEETREYCTFVLKMAWSRYSGGVWQATATTPPYSVKKTVGELMSGRSYGGDIEEFRNGLIFTAGVDSATNNLTMIGYNSIWYGNYDEHRQFIKYTFKGGSTGAAKIEEINRTQWFGTPDANSIFAPSGYRFVNQMLAQKGKSPEKLWDKKYLVQFPTVDYKVLPIRQDGSDARENRTCFFQDEEHSFVTLSHPDVMPFGRTTDGKSFVIPNLQVIDLYHPHVEKMYGDLNQYGVGGLLSPDPTSGDAFDRRKQLKFSSSLPIQDWFKNTYGGTGNKIGSSVMDTYPIENIDFEESGSFATYNWEMFFHIPMLIANRLNQNQRFREARRWYHYVYDPTVKPASSTQETTPQAYWRVRPFSEEKPELLADTLARLSSGDKDLKRCVAKWQKYPFKPHLIARYRPVAYMKNVVMKYMDNLIAWGDNLFQQDSIESINEATQLYVLVAQTLGPKPFGLPGLEHIPKSYSELKTSGLGPLSNVLLGAEQKMSWTQPPLLIDTGTITQVNKSNSSGTSIVPEPFPLLQPGPVEVAKTVLVGDERSLGGYADKTSQGNSDLPGLFHFCIPHNSFMLKYWDTVADRLFKIRNCMNIKGVVRTLPLFQPPIDPALMVRAAAAGIDLSTVLSDLYAPLPGYRYSVLNEKAKALCHEVKAFGSNLLSALEKRDSEALSRMTSAHRVKLLGLVTEVRKKQVKEAVAALDASKMQLSMVEQRSEYYKELVENGLSGYEDEQLESLDKALILDMIGRGFTLAGAILHLVPTFKITNAPLPGFGQETGGNSWGQAANAVGSAFSTISSYYSQSASMSAIRGSQERREQEWKQQVIQAKKELTVLSKQIVAAEIRLAIAENEKSNQSTELTQAKEQEKYLRSKFTDKELYSWMVSQLSGLYFQSYKLAYDLAKKTQRTFEFELGKSNGATNYIQFGYWDSLKKGLLAGEKLGYDLNRMESAYLDSNTREYELTKHISLAQFNPIAMVKLRETGTCNVELPEEIFDFDYPDHYKRRIKSISLSMPCVAAPHSTIACELDLTSSEVRLKSNSILESAMSPSCTSIATSHGQNDSGVFELNFGDARYLPFEGAGAVSKWTLAVPTWRHFERLSMTDVVFHISYTALGGRTTELNQFPGAFDDMEIGDTYNVNGDECVGLFGMISAKHDYPEEWSAFVSGGQATLTIGFTNDMLPIALRDAVENDGKAVSISRINVFLDVPGIDNPTITINSVSPTQSFAPLVTGQKRVYWCELEDTSQSWIFSDTAPSTLLAAAEDLVVMVHYKVS